MRLAALLLLLCLPLPVWATTSYVATSGNDSHSCVQAQSQATPKRSINAAVACVAPGGTVQIAEGTYDELLIGPSGSSRDCPASVAAVQQPCAVIPSGPSPEHPTRLLGTGAVVVSPRGRQYPGGGGIYTGFAGSTAIHLEGLRFVTHEAAGSGSGVVLGAGTYLTVTRSEVAGGTLGASTGASHVTITFNDIHHAGQWAGVVCDTFVQRSPPCPHGMYFMGSDSVIASNVVRYNSNYGIQVSAEQGGIARVRVEGNVVLGNPGVGIRIQGDSNSAVANVLVGNGRGIAHAGTHLTIAHNTIVGYDAREPDPTAIQGSGAATIANNLLYGQKSWFYLIQQESYTPPPSEIAHHNMSEMAGNSAAVLLAPPEAVFTDYAARDYSLKAGSPARGAGVAVSGVTRDVLGHAYPTPPDLGAYAAGGGTPIPPEPEPPGDAAVLLTCTGVLRGGAVAVACAKP